MKPARAAVGATLATVRSTMDDNQPSSWRDRLLHLAAEVRDELARTGHALGVGEHRPHAIVAYRGYGHGRRALVHGRVLEAEDIAPATPTDGTWQNLLNTFRRFDSEPLAHARVAVTIAGTTREVAAD